MDPLLTAVLWIVAGIAAFIALLCLCSLSHPTLPPRTYYDDEHLAFAECYTLGDTLYRGDGQYPIYEAIPQAQRGRFVVQVITPETVGAVMRGPMTPAAWDDVKLAHLMAKQKCIKQRQEPSSIPAEERFKVLWLKTFVDENAVYRVSQFNKRAKYKTGSLEPPLPVRHHSQRPTSIGFCCDLCCECCFT
ncbi:hypothetical protein SPRG_12406 [Saprolegnia parasitica CBS 223.65]|uniref:Uncharacterized protein n=1 Tax=Saprolegnia parasitica (strain CBS 223.65) TaxID=695850 RepID=A0A067BX27_SAPPC|nr:hypothetical protein SPRG_12406 [Saprolegnia parasitica CBS 223.65]KDO21400.1 hypothetical protein SPRG_12406 [Saprolegnia parasitica CBS 223.65]|eukprot:XP_012207848.1 hypothetical protein SPRG_12406 [Saprolegnia parasitica CBS 223.65]